MGGGRAMVNRCILLTNDIGVNCKLYVTLSDLTDVQTTKPVYNVVVCGSPECKHQAVCTMIYL